MKQIERIEEKLKHTASLDNQSRSELLSLLADLKADVGELGEGQGDHAESIAGFAGAAAHEALRETRNPDLLKLAVEGLSGSVKDVEADHPRLVQTVNGICTMLSNLGI
jgi:hypothetical protein